MSPFRRWQGSLKYKLVVYFLAVSLLPIGLVGYLFYSYTTGMMVKKDTAHSIELNFNQIGSLDRIFSGMVSLMSDITTAFNTTYLLKNITDANYETDRSFSVMTEVSAQLDSFRLANDELIDSIYLLPRYGGIPIFKGTYSTEYNGDYTKLPIYRQTVDNPTRMLWLFERDPVSGVNTLTLSKAVSDVFEDESLGIAIIHLNLGNMLEEIENTVGKQGEALFIVNRERQIVFHSDRSLIGTALASGEGLDRIWEDTSGSFVGHWLGSKVIVTQAESKVNGWKIVNIIPYHNAVKDVTALTRITLAVTVLAVIVATTIAVFVYRNLYRPISALMRGMKTMERGNFDVRVELDRQDEFGALSRSFNYLTTRVEELIEDVKTEQFMKKELEIRALQAQITPHFLYNTLNSIQSLSRLGRNDDIVKMTGALIDLLRVSASHNHDAITIREELDYVESYVKIMELRYGSPFHLRFERDETLLDCRILKFTLQPIVENCIIHAFKRPMAQKAITIKLYADEGDIHIVVADNGSGFDPSVLKVRGADGGARAMRRGSTGRNKFSGMGIANIHERLRLHYGERYGLRFETEPGQGTRVHVAIPFVVGEDAIPPSA